MDNRLRELRAIRKWSQAELADRLDVSRQTVNAIETGRYDPSLPRAFSPWKSGKSAIVVILDARPLGNLSPRSARRRPRPLQRFAEVGAIRRDDSSL